MDTGKTGRNFCFAMDVAIFCHNLGATYTNISDNAQLVKLLNFFIRIIGKYIGAFRDTSACSMEIPFRNYLGLALIPACSAKSF